MKMSMKIAFTGHIELKLCCFFLKKALSLWVPFCHVDNIYDVTIEFPDSKTWVKTPNLSS